MNDAHDVLMEQAELVCSDNCGWYGSCAEAEPHEEQPFDYQCPECMGDVEDPQGPSIGFDDKAIEQVMENTLRLVVRVNRLPEYNAWFSFNSWRYSVRVYCPADDISKMQPRAGDYDGIHHNMDPKDFDWQAARDLINELDELLKGAAK